MPKLLRMVPAEVHAVTSVPAVPVDSGGERALELVAMRGKDIVGVKHLVSGARAWIGEVGKSIVRVDMREFGGIPRVVAEMDGEEPVLFVPPRARVRLHRAGCLPRLGVGPMRIALDQEERAVMVLGGIQLRAQVVSMEGLPESVVRGASTARWVITVGALYAIVLAACAALTSASNPPKEAVTPADITPDPPAVTAKATAIP